MSHLSIAQVAAEQERLNALLDQLVSNDPDGERIRQILAIGTDYPGFPYRVYKSTNPLIMRKARVIDAVLYPELIKYFTRMYYQGEMLLGKATTTVQIMSYFWVAWAEVYERPHAQADVHHTIAMASKAAFIEIAAQRKPKDFNLVTVSLFDPKRQDAMKRAWMEYWEQNNSKLLEQYKRYTSYLLKETKRELSALAEKSELGPENPKYIKLIQAFLYELEFEVYFDYEKAFNELSEHIESLVDKQIAQNHPEMSFSERLDLKKAAKEVVNLLENSWKNLYGNTEGTMWQSFYDLCLPIETFKSWVEHARKG